MKEKISLGRNPANDVHIDERWDTVSNDHADIEQMGGELVFTDHSTNGTVINGQKIHNKSVNIYPGDKILLANVFELEWNVISSYFPNLRRPTVTRNIRGEQNQAMGQRTVPLNGGQQPIGGGSPKGGRETQSFNPSGSGRTEPLRRDSGNPFRQTELMDRYGQANTYSQAEMDKAIGRWNWGAFFCSWLWAVCHKMYWPLLIIIVGCIPYVGQVCSLCLCVYLGLKGSKIAWNSGIYDDFEKYLSAQRRWLIGGIFWFILSVVFSAFVVYYGLMLI